MPLSTATQVPGADAYVPELDGIRGIAISAVMLLHFYSQSFGETHNFVESIVARVSGYGMWGVDLFFVLSGYLITGILWDTRGSEHYFRSFYMRRTLRIFPLYYAVILTIVILIPASVFRRFAPEALEIRPVQGWLWSYLTNVYVARQGAFSIPYLSHFWTLAIEEHFYLFWPFIVGTFERVTALRATVLLGIAAFLLRVALGFAGANEMMSHVLTPCRLDSLCIGAFFALAARGPGGMASLGYKMKIWLPLSLSALTALMMLPSHESRWAPIVVPLKWLLLAIFCGTFIVTAAWENGPLLIKSPLRMRWLRELGKYSYGLYVYHAIISYYFWKHNMVLEFEQRIANRTTAVLACGACGIVLSCLVAYVSFELFEVRFLRLKRLFQASRRT